MSRIKRYISFAFGLSLLLGMTSCDHYFGDKTDLDFIEIPTQSYREVAYVPVQPILNQFLEPTDIIAGFDELIYIVDAGTQEVIALDESGRELSRKFIQGAKGIAQDRSLDLLVIGSKTDHSSGSPIVRTCIYRLELNQPEGYGLQYAKIVKEIVHPFYFKTSAISRDEQVKFNRIAVISDNSFYVTRSGDFNNPLQSGGPDNSILLFDKHDKFVTPIVVTNSSGGLFNDYFKYPFAISSLAKPPQISVDTRGDFIFSSLDPNGVLKVQYIENQSSENGSIYVPKTSWSNDTSQASSFITDAFKFEEPVGVEYAGDGSNYIFVVDRAKDSLYQFTANGLEGVRPPPASGKTKYIKTSFGGTGDGPTNFNKPMAIAYKDRVLYVADAGNGRVLRFKLTLDIR
ncbi:MAG: hypothetical protein HND54_07185 [Bacteroidetes bacterium]|nr:hypothetical protein [Bacteroidota bacterium]